MKALKISLVILGGIALVVGAVLLFMAVAVDLKVIWEIATRYQGGGSQNGLRDPRPTITIIAAIALGAGLLIGLGIGLPRRLQPSRKKLDALVDARVEGRLRDSWASKAAEVGETGEGAEANGS